MSSRRFFSRQFETIFILLIVLSVLGISVMFLLNDLFPNNGGFNRYVFFVKPNENDDLGYFLIIDDINPSHRNMPVDWILHGRGNLSVFNNNQSAVWDVKSYLNPNVIVKLHTIFIEPEVFISESVGPFYPIQSYRDNPFMIPYIKARPTGSGQTRFVTILFPLNQSQTLPNITTNPEVGYSWIGENDLIFSQPYKSTKTFQNFTTDAEILFSRLNNSDISNFILKQGNLLTYQNRRYFASDKSLSVNLEYQASNVTGELWCDSPTFISLNTPFTPNITLFNGVPILYSYDPINQTVNFVVSKNGSLTISETPIKSAQSSFTLCPEDKPEKIPFKQSSTKSYGSHPFLYFTESTLPPLRNRVLNQQPWRDWFSTAETNAINQLTVDFSAYTGEQRSETALNLAFTGVIRQNISFLNKAKEILQAIDEVSEYSIHLGRARACSSYALTYDMIYQNLSTTERIKISDKLGNHTLPLVDKMPILPRNNHIGIVASGIGVVGLALEKSDWVDIGVAGNDDYFSTSFAADGGNYEGYSYAGYYLESALKFFYALQNVGGRNYFADSTFLAFINNTISCFSPLTTIPLFEDSTVSPQIIESLHWTSCSIYPTAPLLSNYSQWIVENRLLNDGLLYDGNYLESSADWSSGFVNRICMNTFNVTPVQPTLCTMTIHPDYGLSFFRSAWSSDALYLALTCKSETDFQYHLHRDENSFELWAYGAWLATNPGYPGYGRGEYDRIIQTEASNTLLLNDKGQQRVNGDGFHQFSSSSQVDEVMASGNFLYSSPGSLSMNNYFLGVIIFIFSNLIIVGVIITHLRNRAYRSNIVFTPEEQKPTVKAIKSSNLSLKIHLYLIFGLCLGVLISLLSFFLYANVYIEEYTVSKHGHIATLVPIIELTLVVLTPLILILLLGFKFKMQDSILRRIVKFSTNLKGPQIPPLKNSIKLSYRPQVFFLLIFIPIIYFLYLPLINDIINFIFTRAGSLLDIQNHIIDTLSQYILLFTLTLFLYLPFKVLGLYRGGESISEKIKQPISDSVLMLSASYLLYLTLITTIIFIVTLAFFYALNFLGVAFIV